MLYFVTEWTVAGVASRRIGALHICAYLWARLINSGLSREPDSGGFQQLWQRADSWGCGATLAGVPFSPMASYLFSPGFLQESSARCTDILPLLWLRQRASGVSLKGGVPPGCCCCFYYLIHWGAYDQPTWGCLRRRQRTPPMQCSFPTDWDDCGYLDSTLRLILT